MREAVAPDAPDGGAQDDEDDMEDVPMYVYMYVQADFRS